MTQLVQSLPRTYTGRRVLLAVLLAAGLAAASTLAIVQMTRGGHAAATRSAHVYTAPGHAFAIAYPSGWRAFGQSQVRGVQGSPALILRRADRRAMIVVRPTAAPGNEPLSKLAAALTTDLKKRFTDFKPVNARVARTRGGAAFLYTFARTKAGLVQSIMVARAGSRIYSLYAVAPAAAPGIAREAGAILGTFGR